MPFKKPGHISLKLDEQQDEILTDDTDLFNTNSNLTLQIGLTDQDETASPSTPGCVSIESNGGGVGYVNFEVISTDTIKEGRSSYVVYKVLISGHGIEKTPGIVEKRYSDFEKYNLKLRKKFPEVMHNMAFPGKLLTGNFKSETIAKRSRAFEQYLNHLMSVNEIRFSSETKQFFYENDSDKTIETLTTQNYAEAISLLEKCLPIQEKLMGTTHNDVVRTLCSLVVSYQALGNREKAVKYASSGLFCIEDNTDSPYYLPLLQTAIYLNWMLGREKTDLEARLSELAERGISTEIYTNLLDTIVRESKC